MVDYVYRDGARLTPWMNYQIDRLSRDMQNAFGVRVLVSSGIRLGSEQLAIWYERYTRTPNGRRVYDTRWWNGQLWYRVSPAGTVAQPKTSNHEIQGSKAAVDLRDTGSDAGITSKNSVRGRWIRQNAHKYGMVASGDGFREGWHFDITGIFNAVPGSPAGGGTYTPKEWDAMATQAEVQAAVLGALGQRGEVLIVSYAANNWRNGIAFVGQGFWHGMTEEEWTQMRAHGLNAGIRVVTPVNDRDYDVIRALYTQGLVQPPMTTDAQVAEVVKKINAATNVDIDDADLARIAKAVRGAFAADPIK